MRAPINTAIWFLVWFLLVGWGLLYRSRQTDEVKVQLPPLQEPQSRPVPEVQPAPRPIEGAPVDASGDTTERAKRTVPVITERPAAAVGLMQLVKLLSLHVWEGVNANEALAKYAAATTSRREEALKLGGVLAHVNAQGLNKSKASGDAWARLIGVDSRFELGDILTTMGGFKRAFASGDISLQGTARDVATAIDGSIQKHIQMQRPIPSAVWVASMDLRDRFHSGRRALEAVNADIDCVVQALLDAGAALPDVSLAVRFAPDLPVPPAPFPFDVAADSKAAIVLVPRASTPEEKKEQDYIFRPDTRPPTRGARIRELLEADPTWATRVLENRRLVTASMVLGTMDAYRYAFTFTWTTSDPTLMRKRVLEAATNNPQSFACTDNLMDAGNRILWQYVADCPQLTSADPRKDFREFLTQAIAKDGWPFNIEYYDQQSSQNLLFRVERAPRGTPGLVPVNNPFRTEEEERQPMPKLFGEKANELFNSNGELDLEKLKALQEETDKARKAVGGRK